MTLLVTVDFWLLQVALLISAGLALLLVVMLVCITAARERQRQHRSALTRRWLATLTPAFDAEQAEPIPPQELVVLGHREKIALISALTAQLSEETLQHVRDASGAAALIATGRQWSTSRRWWRRLHGLRTLVLLGEPSPVAVSLLSDPHPEVRAEAAALVSLAPAETGAIRQLIAMLGDPAARCRLAAEEALLTIGASATPVIMAELDARERPSTAALLRIARRIASPALLEVALRLDQSGSALTRTGAAQLLTAIGGEAASSAVERLLADPDPAVRAAAANGLGVLGAWMSAPQLAACLHDPAWDVRRAAAGSLRSLGPTGRMYLRRAAAGSNPAESQMAQHVLDLPQSSVNLVVS